MICYFAYDIKDNRIRKKVIESIQNLGFVRIQKSIFLGDIDKKKYLSLQITIGNIIDFQEDSILIFPQCQEDFHESIFLSKNDSQKRFLSSFLFF